MRSRRILLLATPIIGLGWACIQAGSATDEPLPSWQDGSAKRAIMDFVARVTRDGGSDFVPPAERIATFDNDGTLWAEQPIYFQVAFALDRVKALAPQHPEWKDRQPFKAVIEGNLRALAASGEKGIVETMAVTHTGITTEGFTTIVADWLSSARHPRFNRPYTALVYQPMLELLAYLRASRRGVGVVDRIQLVGAIVSSPWWGMDVDIIEGRKVVGVAIKYG
jgi:haloacid dehalogenase-like hydrolase